MKKILAAVLVMTLILSLSAAALACENESGSGLVYITGGSVNLRYDPCLNGGIIMTVHNGDWCEYMGYYSVDERGVVWYLVEWYGNVGWVSSRYSELYW